MPEPFTIAALVESSKVIAEEALKETAESTIKESAVKESLLTIENTSLEALKAQNELLSQELSQVNEIQQLEQIKLQKEIGNRYGWSDGVTSRIDSFAEAEVYDKVGLEEREINNKPCLVRKDINWEQLDSMGRSNIERAKAGLSPISSIDNKTVELHHIGQNNDSPLAELTYTEHRENSSVLHDYKKESEINRLEFSRIRSDHWKTRINEGV